MMKAPSYLVVVLVTLVFSLGCDPDLGLLLPAYNSDAINTTSLTLVARIVHITDSHVIDEESPGRFAGGECLVDEAWRPYESYSTQLLDGFVRTANRIHAAGRPIDFLVHTGDACDNVQSNELGWLLAVLDGEVIDPLSGPDDRPVETRPPPLMDPHAAFEAQGLYQTGRHGDLTSIDWYMVFGNHDVHAVGVFPIVESSSGRRTAPLPLPGRPGFVLPKVLDPVSSFAYGNITPAQPGPPAFFEFPRYVEPNLARAFFNKRECIRAMFDTEMGPIGHGYNDPETSPTWYSVSPAPGVRLIGLDTTDADWIEPAYPFSEGAISQEQVAFLRAELDAARDRDELVIIATHHPSVSLQIYSGSEILGPEFRAVRSEYPNVVLHLAGHLHRHRVMDRGNYVEIETASTIDWPQEGRLIEIWRDEEGGAIVVTYEVFSHIDDVLPALDDDPLRPMREVAQAMALNDKTAAARQRRLDPTGYDPHGYPSDRTGTIILRP